jgi:hypothetical protein
VLNFSQVDAMASREARLTEARSLVRLLAEPRPAGDSVKRDPPGGAQAPPLVHESRVHISAARLLGSGSRRVCDDQRLCGRNAQGRRDSSF